MKRLFAITIVFSAAVLGAVLFAATTHAQRAWENPAIDLGYDNDIYDDQGCAWRDDGEEPEREELEAPLPFYLENPPVSTQDACKFYVGGQWPKFEDYGENALWPIGCFNPVNIYFPGTFLSSWIGVYGAFEFNNNYDEWDEAYYIAAGALNKRKHPPMVDISFSDNSPEKGDELTVSALPIDYKSPASKLLFGWSVKTQNGNFISQQGLVGGGKRITETRDFRKADGTDVNTPACRRVTRTPQVDEDNNGVGDGMDDNWERLYSATGDLIPSDDLDNDGVDLSDPEVLGQENKRLRINADVDPEDEYLGIRVTPDTTAGSAPGDGRFTNLEEYIWGTNPLDADTDDDGYGDEMDIVGLGQQSFKNNVSIEQREGSPDRLTYRVTTVGISNFVDEENTGHLKILIDSDEKTVVAGIGTDLEASLFNVNVGTHRTTVEGTSQLNDLGEIFVEASGFQSKGDRSALDYAWFVEFRNFGNTTISDRVQVPPTPEFTQQDTQTEIGRTGRYTFRHPLNTLLNYVPQNYLFQAEAGALVYVTVEITNLVTHEFATKRIPIAIGSDKTMDITITDLDTGESMQIEDYVAQYCRQVEIDQLPNPPFCVYRGRSLNEILPWIAFEGSKVEITAQAVDSNAEDATYLWWVNDELQAEPYGADSEDNKLTILPDSGIKIYNVKVKAYSNNIFRNELFGGQIEMSVIGPSAVITPDVAEPVTGDSVNLTGQLLNFPESSVASYNWKIVNPDGTESVLTGKDITLPSSTAGNYAIELNIDFEGANNSQRILTQHKDIVIRSAPQTVFNVSQALASMKSIVMGNSMALYRFFLVAFVVIIGMLYMFGTFKKKSKQHEE